MSKLKGLKGTEITRNNLTIVSHTTKFQNGLSDWPKRR